MPQAGDIIDLYERHAEAWDRARTADLTLEREWMERFTALLPAGGSVLDLGCGSGQPIGRYFLECGFDVVGVDSSPTLISKCRSHLPNAEWIVADMRALFLHRTFNGLIAWNSFFHLSHLDQRAMFNIFREHAGDGAPLLLTTGSQHGEAIGVYRGEPLYHASLSPEEYRALLDAHGFKVLAHVAEDPSCGNHTVWLAQYVASDKRQLGARDTENRTPSE
jgi:SAM-dependent methyltransferase